MRLSEFSPKRSSIAGFGRPTLIPERELRSNMW